jgi:cytochrome o ubiquinol oxidase subunit III
VTFLCGAAFVGMELNEFAHLVRDGHSWRETGSMSAFFTLVGTHGTHVSLGLLWMVFLVIHTLWQGLDTTAMKRLNCLRLFWHFLDVVWIFIFTLVYLMEAI